MSLRDPDRTPYQGNDPFAEDFGPDPNSEPVLETKPVYDSDDHRRLDAVPQLGIIHLIALTTGIAICFAASDYQPAWQAFNAGEQPAGIRASDYLPRMLNAFSGGLAIAGIFWLVQVHRVTGKYCISPGHYVLAVIAVQQLTQILQTILFMYGEMLWGLMVGWPIVLSLAIISALLQIGILSRAFKNLKHHPLSSGAWQYVFGSWLVFAISLVAMYGIVVVGLLLSLVDLDELFAPGLLMIVVVGGVLVLSAIFVFLALVIAVLGDLSAGKPRDWIHSCGVAAFFLNLFVIPVVNFVMNWGQV